MDTKILKIEKLSKQYNSINVLTNFSCELYKGEILGILGANGAGKTTLLSILLGLVKPTQGSISYFGQNFFTHQSAILHRIGTASAYAKLASPLTIQQNLDIYGRLYGIPKLERLSRITQLLNLLEIKHLANQNVQYLSAGEMTRATLAKAFLHNPDLVLLDEPTASLDVDIATTIRQFILEKQKQGVSCIITSHNMADMAELCDRIIVLDHGVIKKIASPEELKNIITLSKIIFTATPVAQEQIIVFAQVKKYPVHLHPHEVEITVPSIEVAETLQQITHAHIPYQRVSIKEPTLDDFFISLAQSCKKERR